MAVQDTQKQLAAIWAQVLGVKTVGPDGNFFALGGHSLLGVKLIGAIQEKMELGDELKLSDLFEFPTLAAFAEHVGSLAAPSKEFGQSSAPEYWPPSAPGHRGPQSGPSEDPPPKWHRNRRRAARRVYPGTIGAPRPRGSRP